MDVLPSEFMSTRKQTPLELRCKRIVELRNVIEKLKNVDIDDLFSEISINWGIRRPVFMSYLDALRKYVSIEKGKVIWNEKNSRK